MKNEHTGTPENGAAKADKAGVSEVESTDAKSAVNLKRRMTVLASVGGASALIAWHKPVIDAVLLPAHAQMSEETPAPAPAPTPPTPPPPAAAFFAGGVVTASTTKNSSPLDFLISSAYAGVSMVMQTSEYTVEIIQTGDGVDSYDIGVFEKILEGSTDVGQILYAGNASEAAGGTLSVTANPCDLGVESIAVTIGSITGDAPNRVAALNFTSRSQMLEIPEGSGALPTPECLIVTPDYAVFGVPAFDPQSGKLESESDERLALLDLLVPEAHAGGQISQTPEQDAIAINNGDGTFQVSYQQGGIGRFSGGPLSLGMTVSLDGVQNCGQMLGPIDATITAVTDTELTLAILIDFPDVVFFQDTLVLPVVDPGPMLPTLACFNQNGA